MKLEHVPPPERVLPELLPALQLIYAALETAIHQTVQFFAELDVSVDPSLAPNLVRYHAKQYLDENDLPAEIETDCQREELGNNGLLIKYGKHYLRVLKSDEGRPPVPGKSITKQNFYQQPLPFIALIEPEDELRALRVLVLWDALPKSYLFQGLSVALPATGGESRGSVVCHWQQNVTDAMITTALVSTDDDSGTVPDEDLPVTAKPAAATGTTDDDGDV